MTCTQSNIIYNVYPPKQNRRQTVTSCLPTAALAKVGTRENVTGNNFLYNGGTELNPATNVYDLFFRNYDPALGRMNQIDPMAAKYASLTPYNFALNNPATLNDPLGDDVEPPPPGEYREYICGQCWRDERSMNMYMSATGYGGGGYTNWQASTFAGMMSIGSFLSAALSSPHGGTWRAGNATFFTSTSQAIAVGLNYLSFHGVSKSLGSALASNSSGKSTDVKAESGWVRGWAKVWNGKYGEKSRNVWKRIPKLGTDKKEGRAESTNFLTWTHSAWMLAGWQQGQTQTGPDFYYNALNGLVLNNGTILSKNDLVLTFNNLPYRDARYLGFKDGKYHVNFDIKSFEETQANIRATAIHEIFGHGVKGYGNPDKTHHKAYFATIDSKYWKATTDAFKTSTVDLMWKYFYNEVGNQRMPEPYQTLYDLYHSK
ncbi:MAG: hypothetical protein HRU69_11355 [Flammeovirgaceae bacterium]|nr:MAG: hypothetical protein HRU69_11355 [Flammeovirgaceae bacterium]